MPTSGARFQTLTNYINSKMPSIWAGWDKCVSPDLRGLRHEDQDFRTSLGYVVRERERERKMVSHGKVLAALFLLQGVSPFNSFLRLRLQFSW